MVRRAHPRSRGENQSSPSSQRLSRGSSPLTRGKRDEPQGRRGPARAHPRSRGENAGLWLYSADPGGSSPLTRGKPRISQSRRLTSRLIPAHAGKTYGVRDCARNGRAHPRSRGENGGRVAGLRGVRGSSPLTRGKPSPWPPPSSLARLIPAHAGKTSVKVMDGVLPRAHPRSRGENHRSATRSSGVTGSSPLTRGKRWPRGWPARRARLIPAHAGKTLPDLRFYCADRSDLGNP